MLAWKEWYPLLLTWCQLPMLQPDCYLLPVDRVRMYVWMFSNRIASLLLFTPTLSSALDHPISLGTYSGLSSFFLTREKLERVRGGIIQ